MIVCREEHAAKIDKAVFPFLQGGPLMHAVAAKAVVLKECGTPAYQAYASDVVANAKALAAALDAEGMRPVSGGTDTHLALIDLRGVGVTGTDAEARCDAARITLNKNAIPYDPQPPMVASGIRVGHGRAVDPGHGTRADAGGRLAHRARGQGHRRQRGRRGRRGGLRAHGEVPRLPARLTQRARRARVPADPVRRRSRHLPRRPAWSARSAIRYGFMAEVRDRDVHDVPIPRLGGLAMLLGFFAALVVASELPLLSSVFGGATSTWDGLVTGARHHLRDRRRRRPVGARRPHQARRAGAGRRADGRAGRPAALRPVARARRSSSDRRRGRCSRCSSSWSRSTRSTSSTAWTGWRPASWASPRPRSSCSPTCSRCRTTWSRATPAALVTAVLTGMCLGFLPHNFNPARIFMGDSGSMLIGLLLAAGADPAHRERRPRARHGSRRRADVPAVPRAAGGHRRPVPRPAAGGGPAHPRRPLAVRARQAAPPPPAARDGPLAAPRGPRDVRRDGAARVRVRGPGPRARLLGAAVPRPGGGRPDGSSCAGRAWSLPEPPADRRRRPEASPEARNRNRPVREPCGSVRVRVSGR